MSKHKNDEEIDFDAIIKDIDERLAKNWIYEYDRIIQLYREGLIDKNECKKRLRVLGEPDDKSLWMIEAITRYKKFLPQNKTAKEKLIIELPTELIKYYKPKKQTSE